MASRKKYSISWLTSIAASVALSVLVSAALYAGDRPITLALVFDGLAKSDREPLEVYLTKAMGRPVNVVAPDTYSDTVLHLADGSYDFACLGALMYVRSHAEDGVVPLVQRLSNPPSAAVMLPPRPWWKAEWLTPESWMSRFSNL